MKNAISKVLAVLILHVTLWAVPGDSPQDPIFITNITELQEMKSGLDKHYRLANDIDATITSSLNSANGFEPIGDGSTHFTGSIHGAGFKIINLHINRSASDYIGLIGYANGARIDSLGLVNCSITGKVYVGSFTGNSSNSIISNCFNTGKISGHSSVGGISGSTRSNTKIQQSYNSGVISCKSSYVGGLSGFNVNSLVSNCYNEGDISGSNFTGGITGMFQGSTISYSYNSGAVKGTQNVGGISGGNSNSTYNKSFWDTESSGVSVSGGGIGKTEVEMMSKATFTGWDLYDGVDDDIWIIDDNNDYPRFTSNTMPLGDGTVANPYLISDIHELQAMKFAPSANYRLINDIDAGITNPFHPDFDQGGFTPMGYEPILDLSGSFNGAGFTVSNLFVNRPSSNFVGLIGSATNCTIDSVNVVSCDLTGKYSVGGIVGQSDDNVSVSYCSVSGIVKGLGSLGGIVGSNMYDCAISRCYSTAKIEGDITRGSGIGGVVGKTEESHSISDCYSTGNISGYQDVGGIVGDLYDSEPLMNCYSTGSVSGRFAIGGAVGTNYSSSVINSFWDTITSGQTGSRGGTGKSTGEMQTLATFTTWDFENGIDDDIWVIDENDEYPKLAWSVKKLSYSATNGTLNDSLQYVFSGENGLEVTAIPSANYHFEKWNDNNSTVATRTDLAVSKDINVGAIFAINQYTVTYAVNNTTMGDITGEAIQTLDFNTLTTEVTAHAKMGYHFKKWDNDSEIATRTDVVPADGTTFTANFAIDTFAINYLTDENGTLTGVTSQRVTYTGSGTEVTAIPKVGYSFVKWDDDVMAATRTDENATESFTVKAIFAINKYTITYDVNNAIMGGIIGKVSQTLDFNTSTTEVTASSKTGYHFKKWDDDTDVATRSDIIPTDGVTFIALFAPDTFNITYSTDENGTLTGSAFQRVTNAGSGSEVTATPNAGYKFIEWNDNYSTVATRTDANITGAVSAKAIFDWVTIITPRTVTTQGTITGDPVVTITLQSSTTGNEDTLVTTTVIDTTIYTLWNINDTLQEGNVTASSVPVFVSETRTPNTAVVTTNILKYQTPVSITSVGVVSSQNNRLAIVPNPVYQTDSKVNIIVNGRRDGSTVRIVIFDIIGNLIDEQEGEASVEESHLFEWDLRNRLGQKVASGPYKVMAIIKYRDGTIEKAVKFVGVKI